MSSALRSLFEATVRPLLSTLHASPSPSLAAVATRGFKTKGFLKRRCKSCYFIRRFDRLFVLCDEHPRHKQMQMVKKERNTWMLSHATQGKVRPW